MYLCCHDDFLISIFKPNHGNVSGILYDVCGFIDCYCFPVFLCEAEVYVYEIPNLTTFESSISYI